MVAVSIIVPCYNEEERGRTFIPRLVTFCNEVLGDYELILIDDGSIDGTYDLLQNAALFDRKKIRVLKNTTNLGKGAAIRKGVLAARGDVVLFIDADGATSVEQIPMLLKQMGDADIAIGYRYSKQSTVVQPWLRLITGTLFNIYVNLIFQLHIYDCLCGFKAFKRDVAIDLFNDLVDARWLFDVEVLYLAKQRNYRIKTLPIHWVHKKGTKIKLSDPFMFLVKLLVLKQKIDKRHSFRAIP